MRQWRAPSANSHYQLPITTKSSDWPTCFRAGPIPSTRCDWTFTAATFHFWPRTAAVWWCNANKLSNSAIFPIPRAMPSITPAAGLRSSLFPETDSLLCWGHMQETGFTRVRRPYCTFSTWLQPTEMRVVANFPGIVNFAISPDGKLLAACGSEGMRIWDTATGTVRASFKGHRGDVNAVAFSPDGDALASSAYDGTMLVWDVTALLARPPAKDLTLGELKTLWDQLASADAVLAGQAIRQLAQHPKQSTALLAENLKPVAGPHKDIIAKWVAELDDDRPKVRAAANLELEKLADIAESALCACLVDRPTLEMRMRPKSYWPA